MRRWLLLSFLLGSWIANHSEAQDRAVIEKGKAATALVDINDGEGTGTAFCISPSGIFVTNAHVADAADPKKPISLILNPGSESQRKVTAKVVKSDQKCDLAILKVEKAGDFPTLPLASNGTAFETMVLTAFGFPFGKGLSLEEGNFPTTSVNVGRVTALRREKGELQLIQVDVQLNPGNSGGAVVNDKGEVVGIVSFGVADSGVNFLIPVERLRDLVAQPIVQFKAPEFTVENVHSPQKIEVSISAMEGEIEEPSVEFWLRKGQGKAVNCPLTKNAAGQYAGIASIPAENATSTQIHCKAEFPDGVIEGNAKDLLFEIDGKPTSLSALVRVLFENGRVTATTHSGAELQGAVSKLQPVSLDLGGQVIEIDLQKTRQIELEPIGEEEKIEYILLVKSKGKEIYRTTSKPDSLNAEPTDAESKNPSQSIAIKPLKPYTGPKKKIPVPGAISDVIQAGGFQYLALVMKEQRKIAFFDTTSQSIVKILPLPSEDVLVAGTLNYFVIVDRTRGIIERWALNDFRRESAVKLPFTGVVNCISAGCLTDGPMLVIRATSAERGAESSWIAMDVQKLKEISLVVAPNQGGSIVGRDANLRAAPIGSIFCHWSPGSSAMSTILVTDTEIKNKRESIGDGGGLSMSVDGMHILTGESGVYTAGLKRLHPRAGPAVPFVPTSHPRFYLSVPLYAHPHEELQTPGPSLHEIGIEAPLLNLPKLDLGHVTATYDDSISALTMEKRVHYLLPLNLLISVPFENSGVIVQPFDMREELKNAEIEHLFVSSLPVRSFSPGKPYSYQLAVESKNQEIKYELSSGPEGMKVSSTGRITWKPSANHVADREDVVISITNGADQQTYETFTIFRVR